MNRLLKKLETARCSLKSNNIVCFTSDMDWASEYAIKNTFEYFVSEGIPLTAFITNPSDTVEDYKRAGMIKCGIHPLIIALAYYRMPDVLGRTGIMMSTIPWTS